MKQFLFHGCLEPIQDIGMMSRFDLSKMIMTTGFDPNRQTESVLVYLLATTSCELHNQIGLFGDIIVACNISGTVFYHRGHIWAGCQ